MKLVKNSIALMVLLPAISITSYADDIVNFQKRNTSFSLDGNGGATLGQQIYLWDSDNNNVNQQWVELERGNGFVSYQKRNTNLCIDGGDGGERGQAFDLQECNSNDINQQWELINQSGGHVRLKKRGVSFSLDGKGSAERRQTAHLWSSSDSNINQHWVRTVVGTTGNTPTPTPSGLLDIQSASASHAHPNYPASNAVDGNTSFATRWAGNGNPERLTIDLGANKTIEEVQIAWGRGSSRSYSFVIEARSGTSGSWTQLLSGTNNGNTDDYETYNITDMTARQVRISGLNDGSYTNITDVRIVGSDDDTQNPNPDPDPDPNPNPTPLPETDLSSVPDINCSMVVSSASQLEDNTGFSMSAGTTVCLANGTYNDVELSIGGNGTENSPITVAAQNPGSVFFEGEAQVRMSGSYVVFQGVTFRNGNSSSSDLFQTRGSGDLPCDNCRITEVTVTDWDQEFEDSNRWFLVYGQNNRIDHSWFSGKINRGALLTVDRGIDDPDFATIDHNYFGDRPPVNGKEFPDTSDNEFEAVRVGTCLLYTSPSPRDQA